MSNKRTTDLPPAGALLGTEPIAVVTAAGLGVSAQTTTQDIANLAGGGGGPVTGSWSANFTGFVTAPTLAAIHYVIANGLCTLFMPDSLIDQGDVSGRLIVTNLPPAVTPAGERIAPCIVRNNGVFTVPGCAFVESDGTMEFAVLTVAVPHTTIYDVVLNTADFTPGLNIGFEGGWSITYPL